MLRFLFEGNRILPEQTPGMLRMRENDHINCMEHQKENNNNKASSSGNTVEIDTMAKEPAKPKLSIEKYQPSDNEVMIVQAIYIDIKDQVSC
jgi:hypothetical protein